MVSRHRGSRRRDRPRRTSRRARGACWRRSRSCGVDRGRDSLSRLPVRRPGSAFPRAGSVATRTDCRSRVRLPSPQHPQAARCLGTAYPCAARSPSSAKGGDCRRTRRGVLRTPRHPAAPGRLDDLRRRSGGLTGRRTPLGARYAPTPVPGGEARRTLLFAPCREDARPGGPLGCPALPGAASSQAQAGPELAIPGARDHGAVRTGS